MINMGYAEADITPDKPLDLCGFTLRRNPSNGIYDPLKARWLSLSDESGQKALLGSVDLISFSRHTYHDLRRRICDDRATMNSSVELATTHTHSGPATVRLRHCGNKDQSYLAEMKSSLVSAAHDAASSGHKPARIVIGKSSCKVNINRRDGEGGSVDNEVITLGFMDPTGGKMMATVVNYACHPVVLGYNSNGVSADYPGYLTAYMEKQMDAPCLFLNGACGDLNPRNDKSTDPDEVQKTGEAIATAAVKALKSAKSIDAEHLDHHHCLVHLPVRTPNSADDFQSRLDALEERFGISRSLFSDRVARDTQRLADGTYPRSVTLELTLLTIGDAIGILFVPGELFSSIGRRIKEMAAPRTLLISGFSNGSVGYLPDRQAYANGGYEPYFANFFYDFPEFDPSLEDHILQGVRRLLSKW